MKIRVRLLFRRLDCKICVRWLSRIWRRLIRHRSKKTSVKMIKTKNLKSVTGRAHRIFRKSWVIMIWTRVKIICLRVQKLALAFPTPVMYRYLILYQPFLFKIKMTHQIQTSFMRKLCKTEVIAWRLYSPHKIILYNYPTKNPTIHICKIQIKDRPCQLIRKGNMASSCQWVLDNRVKKY